uniref:Major facilitator superfamily (MFS) profile domain-containing protein n=1 Tax=Photinus pyralis TaxID=7054 RepID=A0A1Y1MRV1_PHOPY
MTMKLDGQRISKNLFQYVAMFSGGLAIICSGMHYGWPSASLPKLEGIATNEEGSWMAVMPLVGAMCGSLCGGLVVDLIGRKKTILLSTFPYFIGWILVAYAKSVVVILVARFLAGIGDGFSFSALPIYLGEISDPRIRGSIGSSISVAWIFGILLANVLGSYLSVTLAALISSVLPAVCLITFIWMPESPYYLLMKENDDEARKSMEIFHGKGNIENELERMAKEVKEHNASNGRWVDLFLVPSNRRALIVMLGTRGFQQLTGTTAITFYAYTIFDNASSLVSPSVASIIYFTVQVIFCVICSMIVDRTGRRPLMIISIIGSCIALFIEGTYFFLKDETNINVDDFSLVPVIALVLFVVMFSVGMQGVPILLLSELFPTDVKGFAVCFADIYFSALAATVSKCFQITKDHFGLCVPFFAFTGCCIVGLVFIIYNVPETTGKTLEEIQEGFRSEEVEDFRERYKENEEL